MRLMLRGVQSNAATEACLVAQRSMRRSRLRAALGCETGHGRGQGCSLMVVRQPHMRLVSIAILIPTALSCSRPSETVAAWRDLLRMSSECTTARLLLPTWSPRPLTSPPGELRLPPTFRSAGGGTESLWVGMDSTEVAYAVRTEPSAVMAGQSSLISRLRRPSYRLERACRSRVAGRDALIDTFQHVDSARTDTVFGLAATVALSSRRFAEVLALTPRVSMRDSLFTAVASLQWR